MRFRTWYWVAQCAPLEAPWVGEGNSRSTGRVLNVEIEALVGDTPFADQLCTPAPGLVRPRPARHAEPSPAAKP